MLPPLPVLGRRLAVVLVACLALVAPHAGGTPAGRALAATASAGPTAAPLPAVLDTGVVDITTQSGDSGMGSAGTGIIMSPEGAVLTNNHVITDATTIHVTVPNGAEYDAKVVGTDANQDVARLQMVGASGLTPATFGDSSKIAVGDPVTVVGNAGGVGGLPSMSSGTITQLHKSVDVKAQHGVVEHLTELIQTDANVQAGDSGGPMVDAAGHVIGMNTAASVDPPGSNNPPEGFAIPINHALAIAGSFAAAAAATVHVDPIAPLRTPAPALGGPAPIAP
jgi:S1-C subfamily serine protease